MLNKDKIAARWDKNSIEKTDLLGTHMLTNKVSGFTVQ